MTRSAGMRSPTTTTLALKEENARGLPVERIDVAVRRARPRGRGRGVPPRRPARSEQLRRGVSGLRPAERARERASLRGRRCSGRAYGVRLVLVDLRRCRELPDAGGNGSAADLALRDHEARLRAPRPRLPPRVRARPRRRPLLHDLRASSAPGHGAREDRGLPRSKGGRSSSTTTARNRAASRTSTTRSKRRSWQWSGARRETCSTSAEARRSPCARRSTS